MKPLQSAFGLSLTVACLFLLTFVLFGFSPLSIAPVPWPDGSAFYLPSLDLYRWPPEWKMHAQAAFVPSYDQANFNLMPGLPILLGLFFKLGLVHFFYAPLAIRIISLFALLGWAWVIWGWLRKTSRPAMAIGLTLAALWDPTLRWGTLVVRTETWVGLCWILILRLLWNEASTRKSTSSGYSSQTLWKISGLLALSAYFHFEAVILVPATAFCVMPPLSQTRRFLKDWTRTLIGIGLRTLVFLSPWLIYVLLNFSLFLDQMNIQFSRLTVKNGWVSNAYLTFHSLFLELGSPTGVPKFFNLAKGFFWLTLFILNGRLIQLFYQSLRSKKTSHSLLSLELGACIAFWFSFFLWFRKAEVWFITLCHLTFWSWCVLAHLGSKSLSFRRYLVGMSAAFAALSIAGSWVQMKRIQPGYHWPNYKEWVSCIDHQIQSHISNAQVKIWQPHIPDVLVDLSDRHPEYDLTRALDFTVFEERAWEFGKSRDVIILSTFFDTPPDQFMRRYQGDLRRDDLHLYEVIPFGKRILSEYPSTEWKTQVCQYGPYWGAVILKKQAGQSDLTHSVQ